MECIAGPLDGHEANLSDIKNGVAVFGLTRRTYLDGVPYWVAEPPTFKHPLRAKYVEEKGRLVYAGMA